MNEFYVNPVYGFRTWMLHAERGRLVALTRDEKWPTGKPLVSRHEEMRGGAWVFSDCVPGEPCGKCGIYAFENYDEVQTHQHVIGWRNFNHVRGVVAGWGRVILCTRGWRAGKAYPLAFLDWQGSPEEWGPEGVRWHTIMGVVAQCYDVPVVPTVDDLVDVAGDAGAVSLSQWRAQGAT